MDTCSSGPQGIIWELTYACPFRCDHCYSESGRRPSLTLPRERMMRVAHAMTACTPRPRVMFAGGEPMIAKDFLELAESVRERSTGLHLYTSGWGLTPSVAQRTAEMFDGIAVSMDSPDPQMNDFLRGREGAFDVAMRALRLWSAVSDQRQRDGEAPLRLGIECTMMRSNVDALTRFCTEILPDLPAVTYLRFGVIIPQGLASRESLCQRELLTPAQVAAMPGYREQIRAHLPDSVALHWGQVNTSLAVARGDIPQTFIAVRPDGAVKVHPLYEGIVGNVLDEPIDVLWRRTRAWQRDPWVTNALGSIQSLDDWARVGREIDLRFGSDLDRRRILKRRPARPLPMATTTRAS